MQINHVGYWAITVSLKFVSIPIVFPWVFLVPFPEYFTGVELGDACDTGGNQYRLPESRMYLSHMWPERNWNYKFRDCSDLNIKASVFTCIMTRWALETEILSTVHLNREDEGQPERYIRKPRVRMHTVRYLIILCGLSHAWPHMVWNRFSLVTVHFWNKNLGNLWL